MPRLSIEAMRRFITLYSKSCGYSVPVIVQRLEQEDVKVSKRAVYDLVKKFRPALFIHVQPKMPWPVKISAVKITCMRLLKRYLINSVWRSL